MNIKYRLGYTLLLMIFVAVSVTAIALYMVNKNVERDVRFNLTELLNNRVASIKTLYVSGHAEDTIAKFLKITNQNYIGTGNTDEFTIVKKEGDSIHFLVNQRNLGYMNLAPILYKDNKSQAISKALSGKSGFIKNIDYRNKDVYSSYAYIPELKWGITCEIDVDEINQNLFHDFKIILAISILIAIISAFIYNIINNKLLNSLQKSQKKYQNLVENIKEVIYEIDNLGVIKYISPAIEKILGYTPSEITGRNFINFVGENAEYLAARLSLLTTKNEIENEYKLETKTGETRWILFSTIAIITNGKLTGASGTLVDITEKKLIDLELQKSEALYSSIIEASPDVITITNLEGKILLTSPKTFELFGYDTYEDFVNKSIFEFIDESDRTKAISNIMNMHIDELWGAEDYKGVKKDGTIIDVSVNGEFIRDENGQPVNLIFITRDVTERKSLEKELKKTKDLYSSILNASPDAIVTT
ncbi:MAG: PAS domain-containing protein, partial [Bacteroidota bacterium]